MTSDKIYSRQILDENGVGERCLHKWVHQIPPRFPPPDGNLNGRNFWHRSTYEAWKADVDAGKYRQHRKPGALPELTGTVPRKPPSIEAVTDLEQLADEILAERSRPPRTRPRRHAAKAGVLEAAAQRKQGSQP
jgi:hypothetical protein